MNVTIRFKILKFEPKFSITNMSVYRVKKMLKRMKQLIALFFIMLIFVGAKDITIASSYQNITTNPKITDSLGQLQSIGRGDVISILNGNNATGKPMRVMFRDLAMYGLSNCEAVTMKTNGGALVVYINKKHENAPSEAIACLIAHESQHHTQTNTKAEELRAWLKEVSTWNEFVRRDKTLALSTAPLVKRLNYIDKMVVRDNGHSGIVKLIANHPTYAGLN